MYVIDIFFDSFLNFYINMFYDNFLWDGVLNLITFLNKIYKRY